MDCQFHEIQENAISFCKKENSYSMHTDCVISKALENFLEYNKIESTK